MRQSLLLLAILLLNCNVFAEGSSGKTTNDKNNTHHSSEIESLLSEYRDYLTQVPAAIRKEVVQYRKDNANLNQKKRELYKKLSQQAQKFLKEEQKYRKKLLRSINQDNVEILQEISNENTMQNDDTSEKK